MDPTFCIEFEETPLARPELPSQNRPRAREVLGRLTAAERETVTAVAEGLSNKEIAARLGKTVDAVKFLLHSVYRKHEIPNRTALVLLLLAR